MKNKLVLENAVSHRGASMGRGNWLPKDLNAEGKIHLTRLKWVDGDYDEGGAYWGNTGKDDVYCAWGDLNEVNALMFVRADSRIAAKAFVMETLPNVRFYR
jgi:hypothetical protein